MKLEYLFKCSRRISWVNLKQWKTTQGEVIIAQDETEIVNVFQLLRLESSRVNNDGNEFILVCSKRLFNMERKEYFVLLSWVFTMWSKDF